MEAVHFKNYSVTAFISNKHTTVTIVYVGFHWLPSSFKSVFDLNISFHHLQSYSQYAQSFTPCYTIPMYNHFVSLDGHRLHFLHFLNNAISKETETKIQIHLVFLTNFEFWKQLFFEPFVETFTGAFA